PRLVADVAGSHGDGSTGHRCRARAEGSDTVGRGVRVTLLDHDVVRRDADLGSNDLGVRRLVALALRLGAHARNSGPRWVHPDLAAVKHGQAQHIAVLRRTRPDDLGKEAQADPHDLTGLAALERRPLGGLLRAQPLIADGLQGLVHGGVIVARVVLPAERRTIRKLLALDEVLQAQLGRVHAELLRQNVHATLYSVG